MDHPKIPTPLIQLHHSLFDSKKIDVYIKRDDLIHPYISGNKWRKLKYNLLRLKERNFKGLATFGGAYSNHIYAAAYAGKMHNIKTIGFIRGEKALALNDTLQFAVSCGMQLRYLDRQTYKRRHEESFLQELQDQNPDYYFLPEGGTNAYALKGCTEIIAEIDLDFDFICCACGTGGTISGIINALNAEQKALGIAVLKNASFLMHDINKLIQKHTSENWQLFLEYHQGGYAKINKELVSFIDFFETTFAIPLDPIYTGKMCMAIWNLIEKDYFPEGSRVIMLHTGGLQGTAGMKSKMDKLRN